MTIQKKGKITAKQSHASLVHSLIKSEWVIKCLYSNDFKQFLIFFIEIFTSGRAKTHSCVTARSIWSQLTSFPSSQLETSFKALTEDTFPTGRETGNPIWRHSALNCSRSCFGAALFHHKVSDNCGKMFTKHQQPWSPNKPSSSFGFSNIWWKKQQKKQRLQFWLSAPGVNWIKQKNTTVSTKNKKY